MKIHYVFLFLSGTFLQGMENQSLQKLSDKQLCNEVERLCDPGWGRSWLFKVRRDSFETLNEVGKLVANLPDARLRLHGFLKITSFKEHVLVSLGKMQSLFANVKMATLHQDLMLLNKCILERLEPAIRRLIIERFRVFDTFRNPEIFELTSKTVRFDGVKKIHFVMDDETINFTSASKEFEEFEKSKRFKNSYISLGPDIYIIKDKQTNTWTCIDKETSPKQKDAIAVDVKYELDLVRANFVIYFKNNNKAIAKIRWLSFEMPFLQVSVKLSHDKTKIIVSILLINGYSTASGCYGSLLRYYYCPLDNDIQPDSLGDLMIIPGKDWLNDPKFILVQKIKFSHNDRFIFVTCNFGFFVYDLFEKKVRLSLEKRGIFAGAFSHDDSLFAIAHKDHESPKGTLTLYCIDHKILFRSFHVMEFVGEVDKIRLKFSPDDLYLAVCCEHGLIVLQMPTFVENLLEASKRPIRGVYNLHIPWQREAILTDAPSALKFTLQKRLWENRIYAQEKKIDERWQRCLQIVASKLAKRRLQTVAALPVVLNGHIPSHKQDNYFICLALDGDGMQALLTAGMLEKIEEQLGRPLHECFDCIVGSNFGAILALGLVASRNGERALLNAKKLIRFLFNYGKEFFNLEQKAPGQEYPLARLQQLLKICFKDVQLSDALTQVIIPSLRLTSHEAVLFDSYQARRVEQSDDFMDFVAACASSSMLFSAISKQGHGDTTEPYTENPRYKNDAAGLLRDITLPEKVLILSLTTGIPNANNSVTHERLKEQYGSSYCRLKPDIDMKKIGAPDNTNPRLLGSYLDWGRAVKTDSFILQLKELIDKRVEH